MIDWSDPEEMLGLLAEYVRDEFLSEDRDRERAAFLRDLSAAVDALAARAGSPTRALLGRLQEIHDSRPPEFANDAVSAHLSDCIDELERILP